MVDKKKKKNDYSCMSATEEEKIRFQTAMMKAAVQIVCKEKGLNIPEDIDKLAEFIVVEKCTYYGYWNVFRKDHLPCIISDFLGEAVWAIKKTENDDDGTAKLLVKIKDNVWQVDFKDFCKNRTADLIVKKLEKCEDEINDEKEPCDEEKNRIENILKDFEKHKSNKEKQGLEEVKNDNNMVKKSTHSSKNPEPKKGCSFLDCLFRRRTEINYDVSYKRPFHACTDPNIYKEFQDKLGKGL